MTVGTGLNELMGACAKAGLKRPTIEANDIHFRLIIWRPVRADVPVNVPVNVPVSGAAKDRVEQAIRMNPGINRKRLAALCGLTVKTIGRQVKLLSDQIEFRGAPKTGGYSELRSPPP